MKLRIYILFFLALTIACNKNLNTIPQNSLTADQIKTAGDVEALLFGAYSQLQSAGAFGESFILTPDLLASDSQVVFVGTFQDYQAVQHKTIKADNIIPQNAWGVGYSIINLCNTIIDKINLVGPADRPTIEGEALFLRGTTYLQLVGLFAKPWSDGNAAANLGLPLVLKPTYSYDSSAAGKPARATVRQTYAQIVADLTGAAAMLPASNNDFRADAYCAHAMLSRAYLNMGRYADAASQADTVIGSKNFSLTSYDKTFNTDGNSTEDIFAIQQNTQSNAGTANNGLTTFYSPYETGGRGDAQVSPLYAGVFDDANDLRMAFVSPGSSNSGFTGDYTDKWAKFFKAIPVIRLSEMYLTRGEACLRSGTPPGADPLKDINTVRQRAGAAPLTVVGIGDFIEERFRELAFEGDRLPTLRRIRADIAGLDYDNDKLVLPIPRTEIQANRNLVQNPGYN
ncbi:MAG: RagB/SusD family nutrient uptake outer membrane protein [Bacteroidetes bacterium]|nr:RagB/SusD family nutrient uptake outer membrane protein [Bacteroidota bacterium]